MSQWKKKMVWSLLRRRLLQHRLEGFYAQTHSYASKNCSFSIYNRLTNGTVIHNSTLGRFSYVAGASVGNTDVGSFCSIGHQALIGGLGRHPTHFLSTHPVFYSTMGQTGLTFATEDKFAELPRTTIGNDVWIGARAIVLDGVTIGDGCIIAAGSVVTKSIEPFSIVGGVPAKLIRKRFSEEVIEVLQNWRWWDLPIGILRQIGHEFAGRESWEASHIAHLQTMAEAMANSGATSVGRPGV